MEVMLNKEAALTSLYHMSMYVKHFEFTDHNNAVVHSFGNTSQMCLHRYLSL